MKREKRRVCAKSEDNGVMSKPYYYILLNLESIFIIFVEAAIRNSLS